MKNRIRFAGFALLALAVGCSPASNAVAGKTASTAATQAATHPVSALSVVPLTVTGVKGTHKFAVEVAQSPAEQEQGLMFRTTMGPDEGMIFPMNPARDAAFWMKNTVIPLDIIFVGRDHRILNIAANAVPYDLNPLPSAGPVSGVLELNGGRAAQLGIGPGDKVDW
jgi:uncharacterized membrane protein (UPF0127 family)